MTAQRSRSSSATSSRLVLELGTIEATLLVRRHPRARRASLRLTVDGDGIVVVIPARLSLEYGVVIARRHAQWIRDRLEAMPTRVRFMDGAVLPVYGRPRVVRHAATRRAGVFEHDGLLMVGGPVEAVPGSVEAWLRNEACRVSTELACAKGEYLGHAPQRVSVRDTRSRWGSCSSAGALSLSWRLILAPPAVLDYVVAHEVAHLVERGHGPDFWRTVARLTEHMDAARTWLRRHGRELFRYG